MELTTDVVRELLDYDEHTGIFTWKARDRRWFKTEGSFKRFHTIFAGTVTGNVFKSVRGYPALRIKVFGINCLAHRLAFIWMGEALPPQVDHLNRNSLDNRWENLFASSQEENMKNRSMMNNNTSGVTGVYWHKQTGKWQAQVSIGGKQKNLGYFVDLVEATEVVRAAREGNGFSDGHGMAHAQYMTG